MLNLYEQPVGGILSLSLLPTPTLFPPLQEPGEAGQSQQHPLPPSQKASWATIARLSPTGRCVKRSLCSTHPLEREDELSSGKS